MLGRDKKALNAEVKAVEPKVLSLVKEDHQKQLRLLIAVPEIGSKTALFLMIVTNGFLKLETRAPLSSSVGITPIIRESGSSVSGRARRPKVGNRKLRNLLFLCSFNTCKHSRACSDLYERIVYPGKSKKLALITVAN
jgi:transposase